MILINYIHPYVVISASCLVTGKIEISDGKEILMEKFFDNENVIQIPLPANINTGSLKVTVYYNHGKQVSKIIKPKNNSSKIHEP